MTRCNVVPLAAILAFASALAISAMARGDAASDYASAWGDREKHAVTPAERAKLAEDLMSRVEKIVEKKPAPKRGKGANIAKEEDGVTSLSGENRETVLLMCNKAYEIGSRQKEGYGAAARALGIIQKLDPEKRLDSLQKLKGMYEIVYQIAPSKNLGISKGYANVCLQLGEEQYVKYQDGQTNNAGRPGQVALIKAASVNFLKGTEVVRAVSSALRPYAKGKKEYADFLQSAEDLEKDLTDAQKSVVGPLASAEEMDRDLKNQTLMQGRLAKNPNDAVAADRLVRLCINELDDPAGVEKVLKQASGPVRDVVGFMERPPRELTAQEALSVVQWCDRNNDNAASANRLGMNVRTRIYCEVYQKAAKSQDADYRQVSLILKRVAGDMVQAHLDGEKIKGLTEAYIAALEPQVAVAPAAPVAPQAGGGDAPATDNTGAGKADGRETPSEDTKPAEPEAAPGVVKPAAAPVRRVASIKVEAPADPVEAPAIKHSEDSSIFDFGQ